jgi:hypothetical protein
MEAGLIVAESSIAMIESILLHNTLRHDKILNHQPKIPFSPIHCISFAKKRGTQSTSQHMTDSTIFFLTYIHLHLHLYFGNALHNTCRVHE